MHVPVTQFALNGRVLFSKGSGAMHTVAVVAAEGLFLILVIGSIALALVAVLWLPDRLLGFKRVEGFVFVPVATTALWLSLSYLSVPVPGILVISPHKLLAGLALTCGLIWCFIEENWL